MLLEMECQPNVTPHTKLTNNAPAFQTTRLTYPTEAAKSQSVRLPGGMFGEPGEDSSDGDGHGKKLVFQYRS